MRRRMMAVGLAVGMVLSALQMGCKREDPKPATPPVPTVEVPERVPPPDVPEVVTPVDPGSQATPHALIRAFYAAAETNGIQAMSALSMPRIQSHLNDPEWVSLWSDYKINSITNRLVEQVAPNPDATRTVIVAVTTEHRQTGEVLRERFAVSQRIDQWFWDDL